MKKVMSILTLSILSVKIFAVALVCYPAMSGGGWDCWGSNGTCGGTWSACSCSGCEGGQGSSSGCSSCCCNPATSFPSTNCPTCVLEINRENHLILTVDGNNKDLGNISQLELSGTRLFKYSVDKTNKKVTFSIYNGTTLLNQVQTSGHLTDTAAALVSTVTIAYT